MKTYLRILSYLRPQRRLFLLAIVAMTVDNALDAFSFTLLIPFLSLLFSDGKALPRAAQAFGGGPIGRLLDLAVSDSVEGQSPMSAVRHVVLLLFFVFVVKNIANYVWTFTVSVIESRVTRDIRNDIYSHLLRLGFPFFQRTRTGQLISRVTNDVDQMKSLVTGSLAKLLSAAIQALFYIIALVLISPRLTLVALLFVPPMLGIWARFRTRLRRGVLKVWDAVGEVASHVQETVSGVRLVKASGAEAWEEERFRRLTRTHYRAWVKNERWRKFFSPANEMVSALSILALLWYGTWLVLEDRSLLPSALLTSLLFAGRLAVPLKYLGQFPAQVQPGITAAERAFELVDMPVEVVEQADAAPFPGFSRALRFEQVGFAYSADAPVLQQVELEVRPGEVVALVGPSGAGKSTLADLVPRFHDPTAGRITLDGVDLRSLRVSDLRGILGIVTQETILFHDTVRNNIAYGLRQVEQSRVEAAAQAANAHEFITGLPQGYDTVLGEKGTRLSGGQRQRIAIARALLRNPPLLILDEATSALDTESEQLVQQAIDEVMSGRAVLVIAHRLSTVRRADQIVVLDAGRIVERGTHDELLQQGGLYRRLYDLQFASDPAPETLALGAGAMEAEGAS